MSLRKEYIRRERNLRILLREGKRLRAEALQEYGIDHHLTKSVEKSIRELQLILIQHYS